jgi:hypothetical protein
MFNETKSAFPSPSEKTLYSLGSGLVYWAVVFVLIFYLGPMIELPESGSNDISVTSYILLVTLIGSGFLGIHFAVRGCNYGKQHKFGTYGHLLKFFFILLTAFLIVPQVFWTGRGLLRVILGEVQKTQ